MLDRADERGDHLRQTDEAEPPGGGAGGRASSCLSFGTPAIIAFYARRPAADEASRAPQRPAPILSTPKRASSGSAPPRLCAIILTKSPVTFSSKRQIAALDDPL